MAETLIRQAEIDSLAQKLERLSDDLSNEEKTLLMVMIAMAKKGLEGMDEESEVSGFGMRSGLAVGSSGAMPSVSSAFSGVFVAGGATGMGQAAGVEGSGSVNISQTGGVTGTLTVKF